MIVTYHVHCGWNAEEVLIAHVVYLLPIRLARTTASLT